MPTTARTLLTVTATCAILCSSAGADTGHLSTPPQYKVTPLTFVPSNAQVVGINNKGQIGGTIDRTNESPLAFVWQSGAIRFSDTQSEGGMKRIWATSLNDHGWVAGVVHSYSSNEPNDFRVLLWHAGDISYLKDMSLDYLTDDPRYSSAEKGKTEKVAEAEFLLPYLNSAGSIPGVHVVNDTTETVVYAQHHTGFVWQNGHKKMMGDWLPVRINDKGDILCFKASNKLANHLYVISGGHDKSVVNLTPDYLNMEVVAFNNRQETLLDFAPGYMPSQPHPMIVEPDGTTTSLDFAPTAINDNGDVVGGDERYRSDHLSKAILYTHGKAYDLNTLIVPATMDRSDGLIDARGINNQGQIVCRRQTGSALQWVLLTPVP